MPAGGSYAERLTFAVDVARRAGQFAHDRFRKRDTLLIETKGPLDFVSDADRATEDHLRAAIKERWPQDGIVGEERARVQGATQFDWVLDPIDGTANFISGIPHWCTVVACTEGGLPVVGVIFNPSTGEVFSAAKGSGAFVNGTGLRASRAVSLGEGSVGAGVSSRQTHEATTRLVAALLERGSLPYRAASGALELAYVAAGRLLGYIESSTNSWDCFAGLLMVEEAGGRHQGIIPRDLESKMRVIAGGTGVYDELAEVAVTALGAAE